MSNKFRIFVLAVIAAGLLVFGACGDSDSGSSKNAGSTGGTSTSSTQKEEDVTAAEVAEVTIDTMGDEAFYNFCGAVATLGDTTARYEFITGWYSTGFGSEGVGTNPDQVFDEIVDRCDLGA